MIARFISRKSCPKRMASASCSGTYWRLRNVKFEYVTVIIAFAAFLD
jgi:hypothetical protein